MSRRKRVLKWVGIGLLLLVVGVIAIAPSWRNYYLHRGTVRILEDQVYLQGSTNPKHQFDLYLPTKSAGPWPVVVFVHGGFWRPMDRRLFQPFSGLHGGVGVALANHGVATAVIGYRQFPEAATIPDAIDDVVRAIRHVLDDIARQGGDPTHVYLVGHSAGAFLTAILALNPEYLERAGVAKGQIRGFASLAGVYDLARLIPNLNADLADKVRRSAKDEEGLKRFSPEKLVRADHPPMLLLVGTEEGAAGLEEYRQMSAALRNAKGDLTTVEVPGRGHMEVVMHLSDKDDRVLAELLGFMERHR